MYYPAVVILKLACAILPSCGNIFCSFIIISDIVRCGIINAHSRNYLSQCSQIYVTLIVNNIFLEEVSSSLLLWRRRWQNFSSDQTSFGFAPCSLVQIYNFLLVLLGTFDPPPPHTHSHTHPHSCHWYQCFSVLSGHGLFGLEYSWGLAKVPGFYFASVLSFLWLLS